MKGACHSDLPQPRPLLAAADLGLPEADPRAAGGWACTEAGKVLAATARWEASTEHKEAKLGWCPHLPSGSTPRLPMALPDLSLPSHLHPGFG